MKGYKVFKPDWTCRGFQYVVGETYVINEEPILCERGFHFCERAIDCFKFFYGFTPKNKVAEVEALGEVVSDGCKSCTNKISILRELSWVEVLNAVNTGRRCTGFGNSGDNNSGYHNTGDYCSGILNSGRFCSGDYNTGDYCSGGGNTGSHNSGKGNSGWGNSGWYNSGDFNSTDGSSGCFNTQSDKIRLFNKKSDWTLIDWRRSDAYAILRMMPSGSKWVAADVMTDNEKARHPESETTGGFLKDTDDVMRKVWWAGLSDKDKATVKSIPNFDAEIFEEITGIKV